MVYEAQTKAAILKRMLDGSPLDIDKRQGSVTFDMLSPSAIEMAQAYTELDNVLRWGFASPDGKGAYGPYLDLRGAELGVYRKQALKAVGAVTFSGPNGTVIPQGTQVSTGGEMPVYFTTMAPASVVNGSVTVAAEAVNGGASGNAAAASIKLVLGNLSGILTVSGNAIFSGGVDTESDASLLARYLDRVQKPSTSGNANQYRAWALEVSGISDAKVYPLWNGPGTVKVSLLDAEKRAPNAAKVSEVASYISGVRPIGASVTVIAATEVPITINATLTLKAGRSLVQAKAEIGSALTAYLKTLAFFDSVVRYTQIGAILLNAPSIADYSNLLVNGASTNVTIAEGSVAVPGTVTIS